jgi:hypothetical protein
VVSAPARALAPAPEESSLEISDEEYVKELFATIIKVFEESKCKEGNEEGCYGFNPELCKEANGCWWLNDDEIFVKDSDENIYEFLSDAGYINAIKDINNPYSKMSILSFIHWLGPGPKMCGEVRVLARQRVFKNFLYTRF